MKLSASALKIMALITMFIDHIGELLFPDIIIFRIIGRISFPIFAYLIAEGCIYTRNKWKYLCNISITCVIYEIIYFLINQKFKLCVLFGFSLFILFTIILEWTRKNWDKRFVVISLYSIFSITFLSFPFCDYAIFTFLLPLAAYLIKNEKIKILVYSLILLLLSFLYSSIQFYAIIAIIPLMLYSGKKGSLNLKYFFYTFYPLHYLILGIVKYFFF